MAIQKAWGYGEDTPSSYDLNPSVFAPTSWALIEDEPGKCQLSHQSTIDNGEMVTYEAKSVGGVGTYLKAAHKVNQKSSVTYTIRVDEQLKLTSTDDATYAETVPVVAMITIRHPKNGNLLPSDVDTVFKRLIGAAFKTVDGTATTRFADLMQGSTKPTVDGLTSN